MTNGTWCTHKCTYSKTLLLAVNDRQVTHNSNVNLLYSTPSCYLKALNKEGLQWPTKQDDFFPYASDPHAFWTGYFTSRPTLKYYERLGNNFLQICKQLYTLSNLGPEDRGNLNVMREAMGVMQHHDAVTGTEKQVVAFDYARQLSMGFDECGIITETALTKLMAKPGLNAPLTIESCLMLNISQCEVSETQSTFVVTLYNPLSRKVSRYVRLPVAGDGHAYTVRDPQGKPVTVQVVPVAEAVTKVPGRFSEATVELVFRAVDLPPLGFRSYYVSPSNIVIAPITEPERVTTRYFTIGKPTPRESVFTLPELNINYGCGWHKKNRSQQAVTEWYDLGKRSGKACVDSSHRGTDVTRRPVPALSLLKPIVWVA
ncbi:carbohydrate binding [Homalodisca vitripennis]|nr:carbohydrate binding [Homalodisca vitripennis]